MKARILRLCKEERGSGIILFALAFVALLSFTAITVDIGTVAANRTKLQSALDAASLAAASVLPNEEAAIAEAQSYMEKNGFAASDIASVDFSADGTTVTVTGAGRFPIPSPGSWASGTRSSRMSPRPRPNRSRMGGAAPSSARNTCCSRAARPYRSTSTVGATSSTAPFTPMPK